MQINQNVFIHDSDRTALAALKAIPGFTQLLKAFMGAWNEKLMYITNMATNLRISDAQLSHYYDMLPPICDKLGIEVPELYMTMDVQPNAWTYGDTKPYIIMTSGLIKTMPDYLMPTVLAHECGHIACHHALYTTMGEILLSGALKGLSITGIDLSGIALAPIDAAFSYWMRCSEFSADRAAVLCDGKTDNVVEMCMRFAGFDKDIQQEKNVEAFIDQAKDYKELIDNSIVNKALSYWMFYNIDHPINAVRASECKKWEESENFIKAKQFFEAYSNNEKPEEIPASWNENYFIGKSYNEVEQEIKDSGFYNVSMDRVTEKSMFGKDGSVTGVTISDSTKYKEGEWIPSDAEIKVTYYLPYSEKEIVDMHPDQVIIPHSANYYVGKEFLVVQRELSDFGFKNIQTEEVKDIKKSSDKNIGKVESIIIGQSLYFKEGEWVSKDAPVVIYYHTLAE